MEIETHWDEIRRLANASMKSSFHCAIATVDEKGLPHNTPIGSLILNQDCTGFYFERFTAGMPKRFSNNKNVSVLMVNSALVFWLKSLIKGRFETPVAVRLTGEVGEPRKATELEISRWHKRVNALSWTKGHSLMWKEMSEVRDIKFTGMEKVNASTMTRGNWQL
jgi:hypothetical protein